MVLAGQEIAEEVASPPKKDLSNSREVSAAEYTDAPFSFRILVRTVRLAARVQ